MPHKVDIHVGRRIKAQRLAKCLTQTELADELGIACQQVHKYETAINRVSASRLAEIADVLRVPVHVFFPMSAYAVESARLDDAHVRAEMQGRT
ncbi:MAG: helix-turn-helix domain-containing protein [Paracoccaceae bacterium]